MWIFDCAGGAFGTPASMVSKGQLSFQEIQGSARTPTAQAMGFSRAQEFPGSWWPSPRSQHACAIIPRDRDRRFFSSARPSLAALSSVPHVVSARRGFRGCVSWKCEKACKASDTPLHRIECFHDILPSGTFIESQGTETMQVQRD